MAQVLPASIMTEGSLFHPAGQQHSFGRSRWLCFTRHAACLCACTCCLLSQHHTNAALQPYVDAAKQVAAQLKVPLLDLWELFQRTSGWEQQLLAADGIHFVPGGEEAVYAALMGLIQQQLSDIRWVCVYVISLCCWQRKDDS